MKTQEQLINNIVGQLNGINKMIAEEKDCFQVLTQMKAVKSATSSLMMKFIEENFADCVSCGTEDKSETMKKLVMELVKQ